jgi:hypothetical protein
MFKFIFVDILGSLIVMSALAAIGLVGAIFLFVREVTK